MITAKLDTRKLKRHLRKMDKKVTRPNEMLETIGKHEIEAAQRRIRTRKVTPDGQPWQPWAYETMKQRVREGNAAKGLLYKTGLLVRSFVQKVNRRRLEITNKAPYAGYLQFGTRNMPAREYLGWGRKARDRVERTVVRYLNK